jgi:hypothetical protein
VTVRWNHHVPRYLRPYAEGDHCSCPIIHEGQDHRTPGAQVLRLDRWFHSRLALHLPADVDLKAGVRRERSFHRPPQVLLRYDHITFRISSRLTLLQRISVCDYRNHDKPGSGGFNVLALLPRGFTNNGCSQKRASGWVISYGEAPGYEGAVVGS